MALAKFDPNMKERFPLFKVAGEYGRDCEFEAVCTIEGFEFPSVLTPAYDKPGDKGPYALFQLLCVQEGKPNIRENWFRDTGNAWHLLARIGVEISDDGEFDTEEVVGREVMIVAGDPRAGRDDTWFNNIKTLNQLD